MSYPIAGVVFFLLVAGIASPCSAVDSGEKEASDCRASDHYGRLDFSPDGAQLAVGGPKGRIHIWDVKSKEFVRVLQRSEERMLEDVAWSPQGTKLAAGDSWSRLSIHDVASGKELHFLSARGRNEAIGSKERIVESLAWNLAGDSLVLTTTNGFAFWNPDVPAESTAVAVPDADDDRFFGWHGAVSSDGRRLVPTAGRTLGRRGKRG
jgi:WD40 repeat protein